MANDPKKLAETAAAADALIKKGVAFPNPTAVDEQVVRRTEEEIQTVIDEVLRPYLLETIPILMRKLNHQGVFDKVVRTRLEESLKDILAQYMETASADVTAKIDRKFREVILSEYETRVEQAARKLLDERLAKLRQEFSK